MGFTTYHHSRVCRFFLNIAPISQPMGVISPALLLQPNNAFVFLYYVTSLRSANHLLAYLISSLCNSFK